MRNRRDGGQALGDQFKRHDLFVGDRGRFQRGSESPQRNRGAATGLQ